MDKISRKTPDLTQENIAKIAALFPDVVTEIKDADGNVTLAVDFDALRDDLSGEVVVGPRERYQFTWPGKREAKLEARRPIKKTMRPCPEKSKDWDTTKNLYIEGDNLEALKIMRETYAGKVKLIYIDPPYNTGSDFVYADDFSISAEEYRAENGDFDDEGNRLVKNVETRGRFHSDWCSMIYPRLLLARDFLSDDGVIFISIDDVEVANLINIANEVFGKRNFITDLIWQSRTSISNDDVVSTNHNHTLVYCRNLDLLSFGGEEIDSSEYANPDNDPRGPWKLVPMDANHAGGDTQFPIRNPNTGEEYYPSNGRSWAYNRKTVEKMLEDGRIAFGTRGLSRPQRKMFLKERIDRGDCKTPSSVLLNAGTTKDGTDEIVSLFGSKVFDYPKPPSFVERIIQYGIPKGEAVVLDFFSGSASTAQAAFQFNERLNRDVRFILIQIPEQIDPNKPGVSLDARKTMERAACVLDNMGLSRTICDLGEERIRRAGEKIKAEIDRANEQLELGAEPKPVPDIGFRVLRVDDSCFKDEFAAPDQYDQTQLDLFADNAAEGAAPLDLLFQVLPAFRIKYSAKIVERVLGGKACFDVNDGQLIACFDGDIDTGALEAIAKERPLYAVFRDACFSNDAAVANLEELFKTFSPDTIKKVI